MDRLKEFLEGDGTELPLVMQPIDDIKNALEKYGWEMEWDDMDTNGWEHDFWIPFTKDEETITLGGSWYHGGYTLSRD
jgi:hypothetical protein